MGCFSGSNAQPPPVNYGAVLSSTLASQAGLAPEQFGAEANPVTGQPGYAGLSLEDLQNLLYGTPASSTPVSYDLTQQAPAAGWYSDATGGFEGNAENPGNAQYEGAGSTFGTEVNTTINTPATTGILPQTQALLTGNPAINSLLGNITTSANMNLAAGSNLTPDQLNQVNQASLAGFAQRGMSGSGSSVVDTILNQLGYGQQLLQQRQGAATSALGANISGYQGPLMDVIGRLLGNTGAGGPTLYNPQSGIPVAQANYNTQSQFDAAKPTGLQQTGDTVNAIGGILKAI